MAVKKHKNISDDGKCLKKKYFSQAGAEKRIEQIRAQAKKKKARKGCKVKYSYKCKLCGCWHMTCSEPWN